MKLAGKNNSPRRKPNATKNGPNSPGKHRTIRSSASRPPKTGPSSPPWCPIRSGRTGSANSSSLAELSDGRLAIANFLVDTYCLGVKNAYWNIISEWEFDKLKRKLHRLGTLQPVAPEYFAKLVFDAVDYAQAIGFVPHPDYRHAKLLLAGVDPTQCTETFTFGKDGKPFYVNGPHDSPERIKVIMHKVNLAGGHFLVGVPPSETGMTDESSDDGAEAEEAT